MELRRSSVEPTPQQRAVMKERSRLLIVEANAGTGKTTTIAFSVREHLVQGGAPQAILVLTYTDAARLAVKQRLRLVGLPSDVIDRIQVRTFDDFAAFHLRKLQGPAPQIRDPERVKPHVIKAIRRAREQAQHRHAEAFQLDGDELAVEGLLAEFAYLKGTMLMLREADGRSLTPQLAIDLGREFTALVVHSAYENERCGATLSDPPAFRWPGEATHDLAKMIVAEEPPYGESSHPLALALKLVVVDEMHDMNRAMLTITRALLESNRQAQFIGVGDIDQVIHKQTGADAYLMREGFEVEIGQAERLPLDLSYRFGGVLAQALGRFASKPYAARAGQRCDIEVIGAPSAVAQCLEIERSVTEWRRLHPNARSTDLAVLLRRPSRAVDLENHLLEQGIGYVTVGFESYLQRPEALFVRGVLACALNVFNQSEMKRTREGMVRAVRLFLGASVATTVEGLDERRVAEESVQDAKLAHGDAFPYFLLEHLLAQASARVRRSVEQAYRIAASDRVEDLEAAVRALDLPWLASRVLVHAEAVEEVAETAMGLARGAKSFDGIRSFLRGCDARELRLNLKSAKLLSLSTIEAAKGLEFDHVIVPDLDENVFDGPSVDERNLFYVAASRAKSRLTLLHTAGRPSSYLRLAGLA